MADWKTLDLSEVIPGTGSLDAVQDVVDILILTGNIATGILEILKALLVPFPDPLGATIQVLLNTIQTILDNLKESGVFGLFLIPTNLNELESYRGGYPKFRQLFLSSLNDPEDPNRPQIGGQGTAGAMFLLVNSASVNEFLDQVHALVSLFRLPDVKIRYPAPVNVRIEPADEDGLPSDSLLSLFADGNDLTTLRLSWEEPKFTRSLYYDFFAGNKFYVERSKSREGTLLTRQKTVQTQRSPVQKKKERDGVVPTIEEPVLDRNGNPIVLWEPLNPQDPFFDKDSDDVFLNFVAGQYSVILRGIGKGIENGYYYRIRSVPNDVQLALRTVGTTTYYVPTKDGKDWDESEPSPAVFGYLPQIDTTFDMPTAILNVYRAAYMLRFDAEIFNGSDRAVGSKTIEPFLAPYLENQIYTYFQGPLFEDDIPDYDTSRRYISTTGLVASSRVLEEDPFAGAREMFSSGFDLTLAEQFRIWIDRRAIDRIDRLLPLLIQNENLAETVKFFYQDLEADLPSILTSPLEDPVFFDEAVRTKVLLLINTLDGFTRTGQPPNWQSLRILQDIIPEGATLVDNLFRILKSLETVFADIGSNVEATIDGIQDRLNVLNTVVDILDAIIAFYSSLTVLDNVSLLYIAPDVGGVEHVTREFLRATNVPDSGPNHYSAGVALVFGGAGPADVTDTAAVLQLIFGV